MPTYEYECKKCGHTFERFQGIKDNPLRTCPKCRGRVKRLLGAGAGIIFKGSGFYQTDYRSRTYTEAAKRESSGAAPKAEGGDKTEKKAADTKSTGDASKAAKKS